jgi:hypothetical protein
LHVALLSIALLALEPALKCPSNLRPIVHMKIVPTIVVSSICYIVTGRHVLNIFKSLSRIAIDRPP